MSSPRFNRADAELFIATLTGDANTPVTFQTIDDSGARRPGHARVIHGTLNQHWRLLCEQNNNGAGIFVVVNRTDLKGRKNENIINPRALFLDVDEGGWEAVQLIIGDVSLLGTNGVPPHITVRTARGGHLYWLCTDCTVERFSELQKALAKRFGGDPNVSDLPRVMRVPGFFHKKSNPYLVTLIDASDLPHYSVMELEETLSLRPAKETIVTPRIPDASVSPILRKSERPKPSYALSQLDELLGRLPIECLEERQAWFATMCSVHHEFNGSYEALKIFDEWSSSGLSYVNFDDVQEQWNSIHDTCKNPRTFASLIRDVTSNGSMQSETAETVKRLAALSRSEYEQVRKAEAKALGWRTGTLDEEIDNARSFESTKSGGGRSIFETVEPWSESVDGCELLKVVTETIRRYIVLDKVEARAITLWIAFTWFVDVVNVAPILNITSPEKRCGKSVLLSLVGLLSCRPLATSNITPASLFRCIEAWSPTLLIDEADSFVTNDHEELRGIINSGHTRATAYVIRTVGDDHEPRQFRTWGAKALAGIGKVPETVRDRSIKIELRRRKAGETIERLRHASPDQFKESRRKFVRWAMDVSDEIHAARPSAVDAVNDRAQDNWEPLLSIADAAGGDWPHWARAACLKLSGAEQDAPSLSVELLNDVLEVFNAGLNNRVATVEIISALCADEEKPWVTWNRGKPISPHQLSKRLGEFGIRPKDYRVGSVVRKGYILADFTDAKERYLSGSGLTVV